MIFYLFSVGYDVAIYRANLGLLYSEFIIRKCTKRSYYKLKTKITIQKYDTIFICGLQHGRRNRGAQRICPHFSITLAMCPFSCNLVALFENFEDAKMNRKDALMAVSEDSKLPG